MSNFQKIVVLCVVGGVVLVGGFFVLNSYIYNEKQADKPATETSEVEESQSEPAPESSPTHTPAPTPEPISELSPTPLPEPELSPSGTVYTNSKYGYSLQIPAKAILEDGADLDELEWLLFAEDDDIEKSADFSVIVTASDQVPGEEKVAYTQFENLQIGEIGDSPLDQAVRRASITVDGCLAPSFVMVLGPLDFYGTFCIGDTYWLFFTFVMRSDDAKKEDLLKIYDTILSSFRFNEFSLD